MRLCELAATGRTDAEFYQPEFLEFDNLARSTGQPLENLFLEIIQPTEFIREYAPAGTGAQFWRAQNVRRGYVDTDNVEFIDWPLFRQVYNSHVQEGDVLITRTGANAGDCAVVPPGTQNVAVSSHTLRLIPKDVEMGYAVGVFFASDYGRDILLRTVSGSSRPQITKEVLRSILLPDFRPIKATLTELMRAFYRERERARALYVEAEALLLAKLGLDDLDLSHQPTYTQSFSRVWASGRLDAESFQPKYYRVLDALQSLNPLKMLPLDEMLTTITNGHTPLRHDLSVGEVLFITAESVSDFRVDYDTNKRILREHHETELQRTALRERDLLVTIKGRIGNAAVVAHLPGDVNINQDVALLRLKEGYHPYYVAAFLNSEAGKALTDQVCTGQINPFLGLGNLKRVPVPIFRPQRMNEIGDKVQELVEAAYRAEREAKRLLEEAERRVEEMILGEEAS